MPIIKHASLPKWLRDMIRARYAKYATHNTVYRGHGINAGMSKARRRAKQARHRANAEKRLINSRG